LIEGQCDLEKVVSVATIWRILDTWDHDLSESILKIRSGSWEVASSE